MKEISLEQAIKTVVVTGRQFSGKETITIEQVDLISELCANIAFALMHLPTIDIEKQGEEWVQ